MFIFSKWDLMDRVGDVMRLCCEVSANHQIKAAVKSSTKGAVVAGGGALIGGLLLGPPGIALGEKTERVTCTAVLKLNNRLHLLRKDRKHPGQVSDI